MAGLGDAGGAPAGRVPAAGRKGGDFFNAGGRRGAQAEL